MDDFRDNVIIGGSFVTGAIVLASIRFYEEVSSVIGKMNQRYDELLFSVKEVISTYPFQLITYTALGVCTAYFILKGLLLIKSRIKAIREEREHIQIFIDLGFEDMNEEELLYKLEEFNQYREKYPLVGEKISIIKNYFAKTNLENEQKEIESHKRYLEREIEKLEEEKRMRERGEEEYIRMLKYEMNLVENPVFKKEKLTKKKMKILLEENYKQVNEYCVKENKIINVFVGKVLNHSPTHTFLVWSVQQLLKDFGFVKEVRTHDTKFPDITFKFKGKYYAIEVETGTLLKKKKQFSDKLNFLNEKFEKKYLVVVSNRKLLKDYRRFNLCTQRKWVRENIKKMIKI